MKNCDDVLKAAFNQQTSQIPWRELQPFFARGVVIEVSEGMDLIDVAVALHRDDKTQVESWLREGRLKHVDDDRARQWLAIDAILWAVVIAPWILVQSVQESRH